MKIFYAVAVAFISVACLEQEEQEQKQLVPTSLSIAVKQNMSWNTINGPDFYNKNIYSVFRSYGYTFNIDEAFNNNAIYVDVNKYYNGTYIPVVAQMHNTNLGTNNIFYYNQSANSNTFDKPIGVDLSKIRRH